MAEPLCVNTGMAPTRLHLLPSGKQHCAAYLCMTHDKAPANACSQKATAEAPGSAVFCNAFTGTYDDLPASAFMVFVSSAPSTAADAAACKAAIASSPAAMHAAYLSD